PRIRARRSAVTRRQGRRRLRLLLLVVAVVALAVGAWALLHSGVLAARVVRVEGSAHTPTAEIVAVAGLAHHPPMIDVDPGATAARLERLPWVARATVARHWPDGVVVTVVERRPVAVVDAAPPALPWALVDRTGRVLADAATPPTGLVHLVVPGAPGAPGTTLPTAAGAGLRVAASLPPAFSGQVATVQVGKGGVVVLDLTTPVTVDLGTASQLHQKYEDTAAMLAGAPLVAGDVIDVSVPDSPVVSPS
ncbi:MAG: cell division protein FtsQ/DivIB, partial [Acidimicrobiales bacterium]